jgi:hypothetical protein
LALSAGTRMIRTSRKYLVPTSRAERERKGRREASPQPTPRPRYSRRKEKTAMHLKRSRLAHEVVGLELSISHRTRRPEGGTPWSLVRTDTERGVLPVIPESAICVQRFDDSLNSAIRITYRISLRSSSIGEPRYPLLRIVLVSYFSVLFRSRKVSQSE